ncbi:MAG: tRNA adenosine(34) deaminase TadA [Verrucomicrobiota bacterium]
MNDPNTNPDFIDLQSDSYFMHEALRQARRAYAAEEVPVGAVIVRNSQIIARAYNQVETLNDATAHAEMLALTQAESVVNDWRLTDCDLYVTKEPCAMCAGAIIHCRVRRVIFGCPSEKDGAAGSVLNLLQHEKLNHHCTLTPDVLRDDCAQLLKSFFTEARTKPRNPHSRFPPDSHPN